MSDDPLDGPRGWRRTLRAVAIAIVVLGVATSPWWGRALLSTMSFFRLRRVEIHGARFVSPADLLERLAVDTTMSVWMDLDEPSARLVEHVQVRAATIERRLPGTLVVRVTENLPLALVPGRGGFTVVDSAGRVLPIDPARTAVDLPIVPAGDTAVLRLVGALRFAYPAVYARVSEVRRTGAARDELVLRLPSLPVRVMADVPASRFAELLMVEADLARRAMRPVEIDLRFRDQVIARLP